MAILSRFQNRALGWWYNIPLPTGETDATPIPQCWHGFDQASDKWIPLNSTASPTTDRNPRDYSNLAGGSEFGLITWNIDAGSPAPETRISALLSYLQNLTTPPDIIFLQEVSRPALRTILDTPWIRKQWYSNEADDTNWDKQAFVSMTLVSRARFCNPSSAAKHMATIGPIWRVKYPSCFGRDALCCDILLPSLDMTQDVSRIRLINVHLDSLPVFPSLRPRQHSIIASYLRAAGHGLVAGDFNPVLPEDQTLVSANSLIDAWIELCPNEDGITWGLDSDTPFPPERMDKVALVGLKPFHIQVIRPGTCATGALSGVDDEQAGVGKEGGREKHEGGLQIPWSDHSGLVCGFRL
ncbi:hypothetical protein SI65_04771 [Aspergillus cristatus]|uniref:Endonuclease/exonuclease/phosphatase domain-containing protein n=1 Tax=Aspergillus cristatus TaxID=573508 RepID=A0A1E3BFN3_ASPCR|nr:hypothetical protein SI65_04771 [Aspergillus cristatus]